MMKPIQILFITVFLLALVSCREEYEDRRTYCDNLIIDTLGTGDSSRIYVPYAFTPNGDGVNDLFMPAAFHVKSWTLEIYDDCGERLFVSTQPGQGWTANSNVEYKQSYYYRLRAVTNENHRIGLCGEFVALDCIPRGYELYHFTFSDQFSYDGLDFATNEVIGDC
jgi:gliding motility-associated-like protein